MNRKYPLQLTVLLGLFGALTFLLCVSPVRAIIGGNPDVTHGNVGAIVINLPREDE